MLLLLLLFVVAAASLSLPITVVRQCTNGRSTRFFLAELRVGTPAQRLLLITDTGSWTPLVFDTTCAERCGDGPLFNWTASSTYVSLGASYEAYFGAGSVRFGASADVVAPLSKNFSFGAVWRADLGDPRFLFGPMSGILGLGLPSGSNSTEAGSYPPIVPLLNTLLSTLSWLRVSGSVVRIERPGNALASSISWLKVTGPFWTVDVTGVVVGGVRSPSCSAASPCRALLDSGAGATILKNIAGVGAIDCATKPEILFQFAGLGKLVRLSEYLERMDDGQCCCNVVTGNDGMPTRMAADSAASPFVVLGASFFQSVSLVLDTAGGRVGVEL